MRKTTVRVTFRLKVPQSAGVDWPHQLIPRLLILLEGLDPRSFVYGFASNITPLAEHLLVFGVCILPMLGCFKYGL